MTGKVKWFNSAKGYGFLTDAERNDVFAHFAQIKTEGYRTLDAKKQVKSKVEDGDKGPQAVNIVPVA